MANVYNAVYQASPCRFDWYTALRNNTRDEHIEATVKVYDPFTVGSTTTLIPQVYLTNLFCKASDIDTASDTTVPVYTLQSVTATDEIDPLMAAVKIPSASFTFKVDTFNLGTSLSEITAFVDKFADKIVRVFRGTYASTGLLRDDNGLPNLAYSDYSHDLATIGIYLIKQTDYNYDDYTITCSCEQLAFSRFNDVEFKSSDVRLNQRYPYPYERVVISEPGSTTPTYTNSSFVLGYNAKDLLVGDIFKGTTDFKNIRIYGNSGAYGLDTSSVVNGLWDTGSEPSRYWYRSVRDEKQSRNQPNLYTRDITSDAAMTNLYGSWVNESFAVTFNSFSIMNNLHYIPVSNDPTGVSLGAWKLVGGTVPTDDVFLNEAELPSWSETNCTNGKWYPARSGVKYKITPAMLLSKTVDKRILELKNVAFMKSYAINVYGTGKPNPEGDEYTLPYVPYFTDNVDLFTLPGTSTPQPYPSDQNDGFKVATVQPLNDNTWYDPLVGGLFGITGEISNMFGDMLPANNLLGGLNNLTRGDNLVGYKVLWNTNLAIARDKQPFVIRMRKQDPDVYLKDKFDHIVNSDTTANVSIIDSSHFYANYTGLSSRVLTRANGQLLKPLYKLTWQMLDDPSLRCGTVVYVPLHNQYVKCYITKQSRTFDGNGTLQCEAWALEETSERVLDPNPKNATCVYSVVNPDNQPKGEWLTFTWQQGDGWESIIGQNVYFEMWYKPTVGADYLIYRNLYINAANLTVMLNVPDIEKKYGNKIDITGEDGSFYIKAYYPSFGLTGQSTCAFTTIPWDNKEFSEVYVGEVEAQDTILPLMNNHWMRG